MLTAVLETLVSLCLLVLCAIGALFLRRVMIRRRGGTFDCSLRLTPALPGAAQAAARPGPAEPAAARHQYRQDAQSAQSSAQGGGQDGQSSQGGESAGRVQTGQAADGTRATEAGADGSPASAANGTAASAGSANGVAGAAAAVGAAGSAGAAAASDFASSAPVRGTGTPFTAAAVRDGRGWSYGIAQYGADRVDWYRIFSYAFRPAAVLTRRDLEVVGRRDPEGTEELALFPGWTILDCRFGSGYAELALSEDALTGFLSWLEAAPPGQDVSRVA